MNSITQRIKNRFSLRDPLRESLDILAMLADELELKKEVDLGTELEKVKKHFKGFKSFERDFVSLAFSIATGVGKTRLMGAFITYLYLKKGIRNFFVLAPNLTIYEKLIQDFGNPSYEKYVFTGISEFVTHPPKVINGDNYMNQTDLYSEVDVKINIFNIAKFNSDSKAGRGKDSEGKPPRMKRLSEYLGESYWDYLAGLDDLVILMDEAHRYHADASKKAINELKPILGLELTATPIDEKGTPFRNIVYEYNLAKALEDGKYVKSPAIATRKDFDKKNLTQREIEQFKLEDAISVHEDTKNELELYARRNNVSRVKPFILVVCRDINHATETYEYITSTAFYQGKYKDKVLQIDSSTKKEDDIARQFITLEQSDNNIEIVIHVNKLKEGWDVNNLYTIVPLRAANASLLIEQTIGRGLRLPYKGKRTGVDKVDKLTVLAHDNFEKVIEKAQNPDSVLNKLSFIELEEDELKSEYEVITSETRINTSYKIEQKKIEQVTNPERRRELTNILEAKKAITKAVSELTNYDGVSKIEDLNKPEIKDIVIEKVRYNLDKGQLNLFASEIVKEVSNQYNEVIKLFKREVIEIPRMDLVLEEVKTWFEDFDLDITFDFTLTAMEQEIIRMGIKDHKIDTIGVKEGALDSRLPKDMIVLELINKPEVDYDESAELLYKLTNQAIIKIEDDNGKEKAPIIVRQYRKLIAERIYKQMMFHFKMSNPEYQIPRVLPFTEIINWNFTSLKHDGKKHYTEIIQPLSLVPKYVYHGFEKACHEEYKFDSNTEKDFAFILENDIDVIKWLRPAEGQFRIYWGRNSSRKYIPDFIVETEDSIFMCEPKREKDVETEEVQLKKKAALSYCRNATNFTLKNGYPLKIVWL
ncbi:MAG: DEAD/DEAH box helicase family protein [Candidatus Delongbacteria bacterium]|nr:DEAD/DEAH box helicase family protein [Candidatus Delongbacteria bacterium]